MALTTTQQNWVGGCQIANTVLSTYGSIQNALDQRALAQAMLDGQRAEEEAKYENQKAMINRQMKAQGKLEEVAKEHNEEAVESVELENAIAMAKEERRLIKATKNYANDVRLKAYNRALNSRGSSYYGNPSPY